MVYNRLVIIGNGFDLSQGLKSSYKDFLLDYFREASTIAWNTKYYNDEFIEFDIMDLPNNWLEKVSQYENISDFVNDRSLKGQFSYKSDLFKKLVGSSVDSWIDIERFYFNELISLYDRYKNDSNVQRVHTLNRFVENLSKKLNDYLFKIQGKFTYGSNELGEQYIDYCFDNLSAKELNHIFRHNQSALNNLRLGEVLFLNFNYTDVLAKLIRISVNQIPTWQVNIHGKISKPKDGNIELKDSIILGYGDDTSISYKELEFTDEDAFLKHIKSSRYSRSTSYHETLNFLDKAPFDVFIVGHSCGLSDKTLLKSIFEHNECLAIKIFHRDYDGFMYKNIAVSRHFDDKQLMRDRVLPYDEHAKVIQR